RSGPWNKPPGCPSSLAFATPFEGDSGRSRIDPVGRGLRTGAGALRRRREFLLDLVLRSRALQPPIPCNPLPGSLAPRSSSDGAYRTENHRAGERTEGGIAGSFLRPSA